MQMKMRRRLGVSPGPSTRNGPVISTLASAGLLSGISLMASAKPVCRGCSTPSSSHVSRGNETPMECGPADTGMVSSSGSSACSV